MKTIKNKKKSMKDKFEFYSRVYWALNPSTRIVLYTLAGVIIAAVLIAVTKDVEKTALIIVSAIAAVVFLKFIVEMLRGVINDVRETASAIRQYPPRKDYSKDAGYKRLTSVLEEAGEYEVANHIEKAAPNFTCIGKYTASLSSHKRITVLYPPILSKWYVCIEDLDNHTTCSYFGRE